MSQRTASRISCQLPRSLGSLSIFVATMVSLTLEGLPVSGQESGGAVSQPYLVFVSDEAVHLRCGPSGEYYKTDPVRHGQELEVYVETADGWLGVRPVDQSFCWIAADAVKLNANAAKSSQSSKDVLGKASVTEDKTVAWIGTNLGRARRYRWQVQLAEGEEVTIVGSSEREGPDGPQLWYRIVPPSGEFRWIHRDQTVSTAEQLVASLKKPEPASHMFLPDADLRPTPAREVASANAEPTSENSGQQPRVAMSQFEADVADENWDLDTDSHRRGEKSHPRRELADRVAQLRGEEEQLHPGREIESHDDHRPRSLSDRIARGLESLMGGAKNSEDLEPITSSSRRVPDLVPIDDYQIAQARPFNVAPTAAGASELPASTAMAATATPMNHPAAASSSMADSIVGSGVAPTAVPSTAMTAASNPVSMPRESIMTITSRPRMVDGGPIASVGAVPGVSPQPSIAQVSANFAMTPAKKRVISSSQMEQVQREVASADATTLPVLFSRLMARGASAPEVSLVGEAAERLQMHALATRCREYQVVAQRRDGETVVQTTTLPTPSVMASPIQQPVAGTTVAIPSVAPAVDAIAPAAHAVVQMPAAELPAAGLATVQLPVHEGTLVEVYSADPTRPPYAITDRGGRTLAYVTPAPGVDVHSHLGTRIRVTGESGYLKGVETPHVMATSATRIAR
ncbi:hypothetical protein LOC71_04510 [Rhodopirellula sp. JC740]|uniref:Secreted protein n=1 Tax=Rhodopirellula halodulae TaxID=2894198 RepID=A0ABS8ND92_9BACT|nr:hypothetical protein [Rhodopirellula sp. JC740]MCC9641524.1 hypothetical protein [Rhodopirellula sp. JC740]